MKKHAYGMAGEKNMPMAWLQFIVRREIFCNCLSIYLVPITLVFYTNRREPISLLYIDYQPWAASAFWMRILVEYLG